MDDTRQLRAIQDAAWVQADQNRCRRLLLLAEKTILVGQCQMHTGTLHRRQRLDGACQLALQPPLKIQPLLKLRLTKTVGLGQLKT